MRLHFRLSCCSKIQNNFDNKQSIFREWENLKDIELVHPDIEKHHLKVIGGFQFSSHKSDDEWREFGINHFVIPQVLISNIGQTTYLTYTVERAQFDIEQFKEVVNYFEETQIAKAEHDETLGNILRMEDIYVDEWKELVRDAIAQLDEKKNRSCKTSYD